MTLHYTNLHIVMQAKSAISDDTWYISHLIIYANEKRNVAWNSSPKPKRPRERFFTLYWNALKRSVIHVTKKSKDVYSKVLIHNLHGKDSILTSGNRKTVSDMILGLACASLCIESVFFVKQAGNSDIICSWFPIIRNLGWLIFIFRFCQNHQLISVKKIACKKEGKESQFHHNTGK